VDDFVLFLMLLHSGVAPNGEDAVRLGIEQTFAQETLSDHARRFWKNQLPL
jgi:hypothetical protein